MRQVPSPIAIITSSLPSSPQTSLSSTSTTPERPEHNFRGMTISSLTTVTLSPKPHISFNIKLPSSTYTALKTSGFFIAHIMAGNEAGAGVADVFAKGGGKGASVFWEVVGGGKGGGGNEETGITIYIDPVTSAPLITGPRTANPVLRALRCRLLPPSSSSSSSSPATELRVGDHVVLVAEVIGILDSPQDVNARWSGGETEKDTNETELGLLYINGEYRALDRDLSSSHSGAQRQGQERGEAEAEAEEKGTGEGGEGEKEQIFHNTIALNVRRGDEGMG